MEWGPVLSHLAQTTAKSIVIRTEADPSNIVNHHAYPTWKRRLWNSSDSYTQIVFWIILHLQRYLVHTDAQIRALNR